MNSHSSWHVIGQETPDRRPESPEFPFEIRKKKCQLRIEKIRAALNQAKLPDRVRQAAFRRLETARRFLRSDELGGSYYELQILELIIKGFRNSTENSRNGVEHP